MGSSGRWLRDELAGLVEASREIARRLIGFFLG
jgi:hypothetical protein